MKDERETWWFWVPALPKWVVVVAWISYMALSCLMPYVYYYFHPAQPVIISIVQGLGGNAIGIFTWAVVGIQLNVEVLSMVLTRRANERAVEKAREKERAKVDAEKQARAEAEERARAEAEERARAEAERVRVETAWAAREQVLSDWYEQVKDQLPEGFPPPPGVNGNQAGNSNAT